MDTLAINATLPVDPSAAQSADANATTEEGTSFHDALSGLVSKHQGKEDRTDTAEAAASVTEQSEDPSAEIDPAAGIAAMMVSLDQAVIDPAGSDPDTALNATAASVDALVVAMSTASTGTPANPARITPDMSGKDLLVSGSGQKSGKDALIQAGVPEVKGAIENPGTLALTERDIAARTPARPENPATGPDLRSGGPMPASDLQVRQDVRQNSEGSPSKSLAALRDMKIDSQNSTRDASALASTSESSSFQAIVSQTGNAFQAGIQRIDSASPDLIAPRVGVSGWSEAMGQKIVMMASEKVQQAELKLNPEGLGPMQVVLSLENGAADVKFLAHDAQVREALQSALPRLQEMLNSAGFSLDKVSIDTGSARNQDYQGNNEQFQQQRQENGLGKSGHGESDTQTMPPGRVVVQARPGRIDTFA